MEITFTNTDLPLAKEHPWASERTARKIARDHIQREGPGYYRAEPINEKVIQNINKKMKAKPMKKKRKPSFDLFNRFSNFIPRY